ncbi:MAG: CDP-alcohol phosphatidyltransferase family protein [Propylenella sp.]
MAGFFPPVDPEAKRGRPRRRAVPFTAVLPNLVTLLGLCAGLTSIRMTLEHRFDVAVAAIILAIVLDWIDGYLARYFRATSKFGEQLDSLADFVNFGVAPAIFLFVWRLDDLSSFGWICALVFAICTGLRLARFNAALAAEEPRPDWHRDFFVGVPAPAGAGLAFLPFFLERTSSLGIRVAAMMVAIYAVLIALLMVSRLPTISLKRVGRRIPRDSVLPVLVVGVLLVALLASYPFSFLSVTAVLYLAHIPFAWRARKRAEALHAQGAGSTTAKAEE